MTATGFVLSLIAALIALAIGHQIGLRHGRDEMLCRLIEASGEEIDRILKQRADELGVKRRS